MWIVYISLHLISSGNWNSPWKRSSKYVVKKGSFCNIVARLQGKRWVNVKLVFYIIQPDFYWFGSLGPVWCCKRSWWVRVMCASHESVPCLFHESSCFMSNESSHFLYLLWKYCDVWISSLNVDNGSLIFAIMNSDVDAKLLPSQLCTDRPNISHLYL